MALEKYVIPTRFQGIYSSPSESRDLGVTTLIGNVAGLIQISHLSRLDQIAALNTLKVGGSEIITIPALW